MAKTGAESALGLFLLELYDTRSSGWQLPQDRPSPKPHGETGVQFPLTSGVVPFPDKVPAPLGISPPLAELWGRVELCPRDFVSWEIEEFCG